MNVCLEHNEVRRRSRVSSCVTARVLGSFAAGMLLICSAFNVQAGSIRLDELDLTKMRQGWGNPQVNRSIREKPLSIAGKKFEHGVGTHANSVLWIELGGTAKRFVANVGIDDAAGGPASVSFDVLGDGKELWRSSVMKPGAPAMSIDIDIANVQRLVLRVKDGGDGTQFDHADWADAKIIFTSTKPRAIDRPVPREEAVLLTPKPTSAPRINGPKIYGGRPGNPFLYRVPTQGERPIQFSAENLPSTLKLDAASGIITGVTPSAGEHNVMLRAKNPHGEAMRAFKIVSGHALALTPPMGWNHWYTHYDRITDKLMREAADMMVSSGMADVGYAYVSIDDCWMNAPKNKDPLRVGTLRDELGNILPNKHFPNMRAMTDYIHGKGLKAGIYSSPGPLTCAGFAASYEHEEQDAKQFADWGFDFLKYDWCSYGNIAKKDSGPELMKFKKPYQLMGDLLKQQKRDIVFNLCQYGMGAVWEWGAEVGGHAWRTGGDLGFELDRLFEVALGNAKHRDWSKPSSWNDPDYIQIGYIGNAHGMGEPKPCPLTPTEQYSFMSLWSLMAAPLFFSGDMAKLDEFTINVLCNPEVIDIDQDPLGKSGRVITLDGERFLLVKELDDRSKAVGLCNAGEFPAEIAAKWPEIGVNGKHSVRDVWRQKDIGVFDSEFKAQVPRRGVVLVRLTKRL